MAQLSPEINENVFTKLLPSDGHLRGTSLAHYSEFQEAFHNILIKNRRITALYWEAAQFQSVKASCGFL
jgi:hypothetical protein